MLHIVLPLGLILAVKTTELPGQIVTGLGVTVTIGLGCTVTIWVVLSVQPSGVVTINLAIKFIGAFVLLIY